MATSDPSSWKASRSQRSRSERSRSPCVSVLSPGRAEGVHLLLEISSLHLEFLPGLGPCQPPLVSHSLHPGAFQARGSTLVFFLFSECFMKDKKTPAALTSVLYLFLLV